MTPRPRIVNVRRGDVVEIRTGTGAGALVLELTRYESGALELRDARANKLLRQWTPKEVRSV